MMFRLSIMVPDELMKITAELKQHPPLSARKAGTVSTSSIIRLALQRGLDELVEEYKEEIEGSNPPQEQS